MALAAAIAPVGLEVYIAALMQKGDMIDPRDLSPERPAFFALAACKGMDPGLFVPAVGQSTKRARAVCETCSVSDACLAYGLEHPELIGIYAGTSAQQRKALGEASGLTVRREPVACCICAAPASRAAASHESSPKCQSCWRVEYKRAYKLRHRASA